MKPIRTSLSLLTLAACIAPAFAGEGWLTDLDTGKKQAAAENKAVLVEFTGSDWCHFCIELRKKVFDRPEFMAYAAKDFVLVELDFPHSNPELKKKNAPWATQYRIEGYPTVLVLDSDGAVYGGFDGGRADIPAVKDSLNEALRTMKTVKQHLAEADKLEGDDKIKALGQAYLSIPPEYRHYHEPLLQRIAELDKNDISGIGAAEKQAAADQILSDAIDKELETCSSPQEALDKAESYLSKKDLPAAVRLSLLNTKLSILIDETRTDEQFAKLLALLDEIAAINSAQAASLVEFKATLIAHKDELISNNLRKAQQNRE